MPCPAHDPMAARSALQRCANAAKTARGSIRPVVADAALGRDGRVRGRDAIGKSCRAGRTCRGLTAVRWGAIALAVFAVTFGVDVPMADATAQLKPHRAVYTMTLTKAASRSDIAAAGGKLFYRFTRGCDGWTVENRTLLRMNLETGRELDSVWSFASWESLDGRSFRFHARYQQNGQTIERLDGTARLAAEGGGGEAEFIGPEERRMALPPGTVFPSQHVRLLIDAAAAGQRSLAKTVFDGASLDNPYFVNAVIGPLAPHQALALAKAAGLAPSPSWWTRMAYFPMAAKGDLPDFEIGAHYRDDGIADTITQIFDTYGLDVRLIELEILPPPEC